MKRIFCSDCSQFRESDSNGNCTVCGSRLASFSPEPLSQGAAGDGYSKVKTVMVLPLTEENVENKPMVSTSSNEAGLRKRSLTIQLVNALIGLGGFILVILFTFVIEIYVFIGIFGYGPDSNIIFQIAHLGFFFLAGGSMIFFLLSMFSSLLRIAAAFFRFRHPKKPAPVIRGYFHRCLRLSSFAGIELPDFPMAFYLLSTSAASNAGTPEQMKKVWTALRNDIRETLAREYIPAVRDPEITITEVGKVQFTDIIPQHLKAFIATYKVKIGKEKKAPTVSMEVRGEVAYGHQGWRVNSYPMFIQYKNS